MTAAEGRAVTSYLTFYDAAWPPALPPETDGFCCYIGGDTPHVWTLEEIRAQKARYILPIFVRSNPRGLAGVAPDVNAALRELAAIGAPKGILIAWDMEMAADVLYIGGGNSARITVDLPRRVKLVSNVAGLLGGIALWRGAENSYGVH